MPTPHQWRRSRHAKPTSRVPVLLVLLGVAFLVATSAYFATQTGYQIMGEALAR